MTQFKKSSFNPSEGTFQIEKLGEFLDEIHVDTRTTLETPIWDFSGPIFETMSDKAKAQLKIMCLKIMT